MALLHYVGLCVLLQGSQAFNLPTRHLTFPSDIVRSTVAMRRRAVPTAGLLSGDKDDSGPVVELAASEKVALIAALDKYPSEGAEWGSFALTSATPEEWDVVRTEWPVLTDRSNDELSAALRQYLTEGPDLIGVLTQTPVGPTLLINAILLSTGLSWCDTPLGGAAACAEVAARKAAGM